MVSNVNIAYLGLKKENVFAKENSNEFFWKLFLMALQIEILQNFLVFTM